MCYANLLPRLLLLPPQVDGPPVALLRHGAHPRRVGVHRAQDELAHQLQSGDADALAV